MRKSLGLVAFALLLVQQAAPQSSGSIIINGGGDPADSRGNFTIVSSWAETRKDDGRGPTLVQVKQSAKRLATGQLAPAAYVKLAREVGAEPSAAEAELLNVIYGNNLKVYDFAEVDGYLYRQALRRGTNVRWVWKPVREKDLKTRSAIGSIAGPVGFISSMVYAREVPMRVLAEMKTIAGNVHEAMFMISDYEVVKPDPFLAVTTPDLWAAGKLWIVDQWDEPGFGQAPQPSVVPAPAAEQIAFALVPR